MSVSRVLSFCSSTLPGSQTRGIWPLALFATIQLADGMLTAAGIARFGPAIEANPLLHSLAVGAGVGVTLVAAKLFAVGCAIILHLREKYLALAVLTVGYVVGAIVPWTLVLAL